MTENRNDRIRVAGYVPESIVDGVGIRFALFVQGCSHRCVGCHNPQTHLADGGKWMSAAQVFEIIAANPLIQGVTFSGGEPFEQAQPLSALARYVKGRGLHLCCYSGYTFEQLKEKAAAEPQVTNLLKQCDVLVDGPFILAQRTMQKRFAGSLNQRCLDVAASLETKRPVLQEGWQ